MAAGITGVLGSKDMRRHMLLNFRLENRTTPPAAHAEGLIYYDSHASVKRITYCVDAGAGTYKTVPRVDLAESVTGLWSFNPSSGSVPFIVDASKNGIVTNLNSDLLDSYHAAKTVTGNTVAVRDSDGTLSGADPTAAQHFVTLGFMQNAFADRDVKEPVDVASIANINLASAPASIDGYTMTSGDRVLVKDQTDKTQNGIYVWNGVAAAMTRALDADEDSEVTAGLQVFVLDGDTHIGAEFTLITKDPITVDTTELTFVQTGGQTSFQDGRGLVKVGNTFHFAQPTAYSVGALPVADSASTISFITAVATGKVLKSAGETTIPVWAQVDLTADVTGTLPVGKGGTGTATQFTQGSVIFAGASGVYSQDHSNFRYGATYGQFAGSSVIAGSVSNYEDTNFGDGLFVTGIAKFGCELQLLNAYNLSSASSNTRALTIGRTGSVSSSVNLIGIDGDLSITAAALESGNVFASDFDLNYSAAGGGASVTVNGHRVNATIINAALTVSGFVGFESKISTQGAGSVFTNASHFRATLNGTTTTNEYGFHVSGSPDAGSFAFYNSTDAKSYLKGDTLIGGTYATPGATLDINGTLRVQSLATGTGNLLLTHEGGIVKTRTVNPGVWATFTPGSVLIAGASGELSEDNAGLFFDAANNRLGLNTATPGCRFDINGGTFRLMSGTSAAPSTGKGMEMSFNSANDRGEILAYDRDGAAYKGVRINGFLLVNNNGIGVGTTDIEAWDSGYSVIEFGRSALMAAKSGSDLYLLSNAYYDGAWKYKTSSTAGRAYWSGGQYFIAVAASGTIDTPITWTSALTVGNNGAVSLGVLAASSSNSLITEAAGLLQKRTANAGIWTTFTPGSVLIAGASGELFEDNAGLFFDSTNNALGINTNSITAGKKLHVSGNSLFKGSGPALQYDTGAESDGRFEFLYNGTREALLAVDSNSFIIAGDTGTMVKLYSGANTSQFALSPYGHVGFGTSDFELWHSAYKALEFPLASFMYGTATIGNFLSSNAYYGNTGIWKYKSTGVASRIAQSSTGYINLDVAVSGTVDTDVTWTTVLSARNNGDLAFTNLSTNGSSNSVLVEVSGVVGKRTIDSRVWGSSLVDGSGTATYFPKWSDDNTLTNSTISDDGTNVTVASRNLILQTVNKHLIGGIGTNTTSGTLDWNDVSNCRSGNGNTLLNGNATNGPGPTQYFHSFSFEYSSKNGSGNLTQFAIPYGIAGHVNKGIWYRGINGTTKSATAWAQIWTSDTDGAGSGLDSDLLDGQHGSYYLTAGNIGGLTTNRVVVTGVDGLLQTSTNLQFNGTSMGIGLSPSARLTIAAGSAAAGSAPIKLASGALMTTPEVGAFEFSSETEPRLYFTRKTGVRKKLALIHSETIGDGSSMSYPIQHDFGGDPTGASVRDASTGEVYECDVEIVDANNVNINTEEVVALNSLIVTLVG